MGENRKKVNAILRKNAERIERANKQAVTCSNCDARIEASWLYCAQCGLRRGLIVKTPSYADPPFACPPDEEGA